MILYESSMLGLGVFDLDGEVGNVHSLLFNDRDWRIRRLALQTGSWFGGRIAVVPPRLISIPPRILDRVEVLMQRDEFMHCPGLDEERPVSLQEEGRLRTQRAVMGFPYDGFAAAFMVPTATAQEEFAQASEVAAAECDPHLRSTKGVRQYHVRSQTGDFLGRVDDFVIDTERWRITHLVIGAQGWPRRRILVIPSNVVGEISWVNREIATRLRPRGPGKGKGRAGSARLLVHTLPPRESR